MNRYCYVPIVAVGLAVLTGMSSVGLGASAVIRPNYNQPVPDFSLKATDGKTYSLSEFKDGKGVVVTVLGLGCPLSNIYTARLQSIADRYQAKGIAFLVVNSNSQDSMEEIAAHSKEWNLKIPVLKDKGNKAADGFGAYRTNETFLLDGQRRIVYHGAIDDQYGIGYQREAAAHNFLTDAIDQHLAGKAVETKVTAAAGCIIGRERAAQAKAKITYHNQIERIFQNSCQSCHREGQIGPFVLKTYDDAKGWAGMIKEVVSQKRMPPWMANPKYGHFQNDRALAQIEIDQIVEWVDSGAPKGSPADAPVAMTFPESAWLIGEPDLILKMPEPFLVKAEGTVEYQYFSVPTNFKEDRWVTATQVKAGAPGVVHHVICFIRPGEEAKHYDQRSRRSEREKEAGKRRNSSSGGGGLLPARAARRRSGSGFANGMLGATVPGQMPSVAPEGCATLVPKGSNILFQMHYTPNGKAIEDQTEIGIIFAKEPPTHAVRVAAAGNYTFRIPPNDPNFTVGAKYPIKSDIMLLGFTPHMHLRGSAFRYEVVYPDGKSEVLLDVPKYDFGWQITYRPEKPIFLPKGTEMFCKGSWDNSADNPWNPDPTQEVRWGDQSWEEMMLGWFSYVDKTPIDHEARSRDKKDLGEPRASLD